MGAAVFSLSTQSIVFYDADVLIPFPLLELLIPLPLPRWSLVFLPQRPETAGPGSRSFVFNLVLSVFGVLHDLEQKPVVN